LVVSGPPAPTGVLLRAGQRLTAHEGRLSIEALEAPLEVVESPPPALDPLPEPDPAQPLPPKTDGSVARPPSSDF
jgi:hypothetical protein